MAGRACTSETSSRTLFGCAAQLSLRKAFFGRAAAHSLSTLSAHGAGRGGHDEWEAIDPTTVSVAEVLARNGYETAGIVANGLISPRYGLDQGFDRYRAQWAMESVEKNSCQGCKAQV